MQMPLADRPEQLEWDGVPLTAGLVAAHVPSHVWPNSGRAHVRRVNDVGA
eukprot:gene9538-578_t